MTILAELHPRGGTAAAQLGQAPRQNLHTLLAQEAAAITPNMVQRYLLVYRSGLQVLPAPLGPPEQPNQLTAEHMEALVSILAGKADVLILDLESALTPAVQVAVRRSDRIVLVSEPDDIAAKITQCWLEALATLGIGGSLLNIVTVNRGGGTTAYTKTQLEELFGSDVVMISSAPEMCLVANRTSTPVILQERNTPLEQQLRTLAQHLIQG
jgi:Flp pilus assembly CpaE family ATPase